MDDMMLNLVVLAVTGAFIAALFLFLASRKRRKQVHFEQFAAEHGWRVQRLDAPLVAGYLLTNQSGQIAWSLETKAVASSRESGPGSSEVSHQTRWWCADLPEQSRNVVVGPRLGGTSLKTLGGFGGSLLNMGLRAMLGDDAAWVSELAPVDIADKTLSERALCLANDPEDARRLLSPEATRALLALSAKIKPVIQLHAGVLEIRLNGVQLDDDPNDLAALIGLGGKLVGAWRAAFT